MDLDAGRFFNWMWMMLVFSIGCLDVVGFFLDLDLVFSFAALYGVKVYLRGYSCNITLPDGVFFSPNGNILVLKLCQLSAKTDSSLLLIIHSKTC